MGGRTDVIARKVLEELEKNRPWLDHMTSVRSITIDVKLVEKTGLPRIVIIRTESEG